MIVTTAAEIGEGDRVQIRIGPLDRPESIYDAVVTRIETVPGPSHTSPPGLSVRLTGDVTGEVPDWVLNQIRNPAPGKPVRWWRR